ncbi:sodium/calcium exchanger protein [Magnaporthiopsis poae ATCC 64411]|uniref:Sodium/calcium exchanger protein n=1 Tax=Magnaporthiopsis poae (strain ATCC 64411 / 73-15) TaxID=644358 RepID=A0A0C4E2U9_MAGP6|nr:sodium/calcium exchanger protein [Magnaporthiopsis poae ATCC 64411]
MTAPPSTRPKPSRAKLAARLSRPFYTSTLIITLLATYALFVRRAGVPDSGQPSLLRARAEDTECRLVHQAKDQCAFVRAHCQDDDAGLLSYLSFYYCDLAHVQPFAFALLTAWLGLLFATIGIAASDFFSVNLSTIANILGLSESLAGVTFLAFGNGSPDVFSTFAAMGSNSGSMAVGELIGAAGFITAVVAGSMALVREFKVTKRTFVRDVCFFILAVAFSMVFLADGNLHLWECCVMVSFYLFYVVMVVTWHWFSTRRKSRRQREAAARAHFSGPTGEPSDELEPYRDDDGDDDGDDTAPVGARASRSTSDAVLDISVLEQAPPLMGVSDVGAPEDEDDIDRDMQAAAEVTNSMRVNRPRGSRSNTTLGHIRPSFVGALEFRSVLASLQRAGSVSGNVRLAPMHSRGQSESIDRAFTALPEPAGFDWSSLPRDGTSSAGRDRARSHGNLPLDWSFPGTPVAPVIVMESPRTPLSPAHAAAGLGGETPPPSNMHLRPPVYDAEAHVSESTATASPASLSLQIPSPQPQSSGYSSPSLSPFPMLSESPLPMTPDTHSPLMTAQATPYAANQSYFGLEIHERRSQPVRWWPYSVLPPPRVMSNTLFPTLQGWADKSIWDKFVSLISVPSIFLLVTTLPVVETEAPSTDDLEVDPAIDRSRLGGSGLAVDAASIEPETEWDRYRRNSRDVRRSEHTTPLLGPPVLVVPDAGSAGGAGSAGLSPQAAKRGQDSPGLTAGSDTLAGDDTLGWNRWLVCVQIFTGPLFTVLIVWANMREDLEYPGKALVKLLLCSLLVSLVLLAVMLWTTSPDVRPRYHFLFCFLGFIISVAWISTIAGEVVGVLKTFGVILGISEAILGLTIFAVGNSLGDLVADITVARLGYPVMALSACFGGPMLNILLGIGIGGGWMTIKAANERQSKHPNKPLKYKPYHIEVGDTLVVSAFTVLLTLIFLLVAVPANKWIMSKKIGFSLIGIWSISTMINLVVEMTGAWTGTAQGA